MGTLRHAVSWLTDSRKQGPSGALILRSCYHGFLLTSLYLCSVSCLIPSFCLPSPRASSLQDDPWAGQCKCLILHSPSGQFFSHQPKGPFTKSKPDPLTHSPSHKALMAQELPPPASPTSFLPVPLPSSLQLPPGFCVSKDTELYPLPTPITVLFPC